MWFETIDQQLRAEIRHINELAMQQAAQMLTRMLRQPVQFEVPGALTADYLQPESEQSEPGLGIYMGINGDLNGGMLLFFPEASAAWLSCQLLGQEQVADLLAEPASSTLREVGNIMASAFLASLDNQLQLRALPTPPKLSLAPLAEQLKQLQSEQLSPCPIVCNRLSGGDTSDSLRGAIYLLPEKDSLEFLLTRVGNEKL